MLQWQIGDVKISRVLESELGPIPGNQFIFDEATPDEVRKIDWLGAPFVDVRGEIFMSFHALLIETPSLNILVDTCVGNDKPRLSLPFMDNLQTDFLERFTATGVDVEDVDIVICTHLHIDHVGWNTRLVDGRWIATFPNARTLVSKVEFAHARDQTDDELCRLSFADSVQPLWEAGLIDLVNDDHRLCPEVWLEPTPGHTPGHVSVRILSKDEEAVITGDCVHHPMQCARTNWCGSIDTDKPQSQASRERLLADCSDRNVLLIGTHFMAPTAGYVTRDGIAYRFTALGEDQTLREKSSDRMRRP